MALLAGTTGLLAGCYDGDRDGTVYSQRCDDPRYHGRGDDGDVIAAIFYGGILAVAALVEVCRRCCER